MVLVSVEALANVRGALASTRERIERARGEGMVPNFERYYEVLAGAVEGLVSPTPP